MLSVQPVETKPKLILASTSPRRADLLKSAGLVFTVIPPNADETQRNNEDPVNYALRLARTKVESVGIRPGSIVLGADTIVVVDGEILGKPEDAEEAKAMLRRLSGKPHEVITGVCLCSTEKILGFHRSTTVWFRDLSEPEIITKNAERTAKKIHTAGAIFMGPWTPEAVGDFVAGPSHVLPTGGTAAYFSGLTVEDFRRRISLIHFTKKDLEETTSVVEAFGRVETLDAHVRSASIRLKR